MTTTRGPLADYGKNANELRRTAKEDLRMGQSRPKPRDDRKKPRATPKRGSRNRNEKNALGAAARNDRGGVRKDPGAVDRCRLGKGLPIDAVGPRRSRLAPALGGRLTKWLRRVIRVHAHLCNVVRLYSSARAAGDGSDEWKRRAVAGDRTILCDAVILAVHELDSVRLEIEAAMDAAAPTAAPPGSPEKVSAMRRRVSLFQSLFVSGDMDAEPPMDRAGWQGR